MSTQELQFRHERVSAGEGKQAWERGQLEEGGALFYFNADLFSYIPLSICFFLYVYSLSGITEFKFMFRFKSSFGSSPVRGFVDETTTCSIHSYSSRKWVHCELRNMLYYEHKIWKFFYGLTLVFEFYWSRNP